MNKITKADTDAALTAGAVEPFDGDVDLVIDLAVNEMGVRLRDDPASVPSHVLIKFVAEANKAAERRKAEEEAAAPVEVPPILERLDALPAAHVRRLLDDEIARLEASLAAHKEARSSL